MSKVATDYRYTELGRIRVTLSITYSTYFGESGDHVLTEKLLQVVHYGRGVDEEASW